MRTHMRLQIARMGESLTTVLANIRPLALIIMTMQSHSQYEFECESPNGPIE